MGGKSRDDVRVGEIREVLAERLDGQIETLCVLIRKGNRHEAEKYLKETIGQTLSELDKLNTFAGLPQLVKSLRSK